MQQSLMYVLVLIGQAASQSRIDTPWLLAVMKRVAAEYIDLGSRIDPANAWRWGKLKDSAGAMQDVDVLVRKYSVNKLVATALALIAFTADIGRLMVVVRDGSKEAQDNHGRDSVALLSVIGRELEPWTALGHIHSLDEDLLWQAMLVAVKHHSDMSTPSLDALEGNELAHGMCCLLRDLDKKSVWVGKGYLYVQSRAEIERQCASNRVTEEGYLPESVLKAFEEGRPIKRTDCETWPGIMLQFLAWKFDFSFPEMWDLVKEDGAPKVVLAYIRARLLEGKNEAQWHRVEAAAKAHGIATLD